MLRFAFESLIDNQLTLDEVAKKLISILETKGFSGINSTSYLSCGLAMPRKQEIYACLNRFRRQCVRCKLIIMVCKSNIITCGDLDSCICIL